MRQSGDANGAVAQAHLTPPDTSADFAPPKPGPAARHIGECLRYRLPAAATGLVVFFAFAGAAEAGESKVLENEFLRVSVQADFPHVLGYEHKPTGGVLRGSAADAAAVVEINGVLYSPLDGEMPLGPAYNFRVEPAFDLTSARYGFQFWSLNGAGSFDIVFSLDRSELEMRLENLIERGGFQLFTLYFPRHALVTIDRSLDSAAVCRVEFRRLPRDSNAKGVMRWDRLYAGPLSGLESEVDPQPTHWAMVYTGKVLATLHNNIPVFPIHTQVLGSGREPDSASLWNGVYYRRAGAEPMPLLLSRIAVTGDMNRDGEIDWVDGATWLRRQIPDTPDAYRDAFLRKIFLCRLPDNRPKFEQGVRTATEPIVYCTFDQALERIRRFYHLTDGARQIVYLVGWQHRGHDDKYPDLSVVNPLVGGRERLVALIEKAREFNAVVSFHVNFDDAYRDSPAWDPDTVCRTPAGALEQWQVFHNQQSYHISHYKDVRKGTALKRIDDLIRMVPLRDSIHVDAFRYTNDSWEADGRIDMAAEMWGVQQILDRFERYGITVTIESVLANPGLIGKVKGFGSTNPLKKGSAFLWFLMHRKWAGGKGKLPEQIVFGVSGDDEENSGKPPVSAYYLNTLLWHHFLRREMRDVSDDGNRVVVQYEPECTATYERASGRLQVESDGIPIARDGDRFVPVGSGRILVYSTGGGTMEWKLPPGWPETGLAVQRLTETGREPGPGHQVKAGVIRFEAEPDQPYAITRP